MSERFRLSTGSLLGVAVIAGLAIYFSYYPLWHTDVWAHTKYGEWYWTHNAVPAVEPLSPYTDNETPFANVAWLSQVSYYGLYEFGASIAGGDAESQLHGGAEALRSFHLLLLIGRFALLWLALKRFGGSSSWATLGLLLYLFAVGIGSAIQRPQAFGLLFFTAIIFALSTPTITRRATIWLPTMFLFWANLHGTFMAGLAVLGLHTLGRAIERGLFNREVRRLIVVGLLCGVATVINPHGLFIYKHLFAFSSHPNLKSMTEWHPMKFSLSGGAHWPYLMSIVLLAFVRILGGRKVSAAGWLVALPFAIWPWLQVRMMLWWWTVAVWLLARLGPGLGDRFPTLPSLPEGPPTRAKAWLAVLLVAVAVFMFPPVRAIVPGMPDPLDQTVATDTPWRLALELKTDGAAEGRWLPSLREALREHYPHGQSTGTIFASETQGDFLIWALPPDIPVLMFTHAHVFGVEHWEACRDVKAANPGWRDFLARHRVNLIVVETESHQELVRELRDDPEWIVVATAVRKDEEVRVLIAIRKKPL